MDVEVLQRALTGRYTIEHELEATSRVVQWSARDRDGEAILLQLLRPELAGGVDPASFTTRLDAVALLRHPHLLPVVDHGVASGLPFVARPLVEGMSLRGWLEREGRLSFLEAVRVLFGLAASLAAIHEVGLAHGALEPRSVLWSEGHVRVADLGFGAGGLPSEDVLAFGALAYEALTGTVPDRRGAPVPVNALREHQPPGLAHLVMRCLDRDPEARPTAAELRDRLEVVVTPAQGYRSGHLVAQAEFLLRRGDAGARRAALERLRRAAELDSPGST